MDEPRTNGKIDKQLPTMKDSKYTISRKSELIKSDAFLEAQLDEAKLNQSLRSNKTGPTITLTNEVGAGAHTLARRIAERLNSVSQKNEIPWTVYDRELIDRVLAENRIHPFLANYLNEEPRSYMRDLVDELLGERPTSWNLAPMVAETVLQLAQAGHVILVGRGSNYITSRLNNVLRVHLSAKESWRVERVKQGFSWTSEQALEFVRKGDRGLAGYSRQHFGKDVNGQEGHDLTIRTDRIGLDLAEDLIVLAATKKLRGFGESLRQTPAVDFEDRSMAYELPAGLLE